MTELQNIDTNINGEVPTGQKTIFRVRDIKNAVTVLANCKSVVKALIQHPSLSPESNQWKNLFPAAYVKFIDSLGYDDFKYDELLYPIDSVVEDFQDEDLREWRWYSSKIHPDGFEIVFEGWCSFRNYWLIHAQNIPYSKMEIYTDKKQATFIPTVIKDATLDKNPL